MVFIIFENLWLNGIFLMYGFIFLYCDVFELYIFVVCILIIMLFVFLMIGLLLFLYCKFFMLYNFKVFICKLF